VKIEVWSDVVCPWCIIGKRRLEAAIAERPDLDVDVVYRSFELDPSQTPLPEGGDLADVLAKKYSMTRGKALAMIDHVAKTAAEEGVAMNFETQKREAGSFDAHRQLQLARVYDAESGTQTQVALKERLMTAWFCEGRSIRDPASLRALAVEAGLPEDRVDAVLADPEAHASEVRDDEATARSLGVSGVPFFVFDRKVGVSGAQPKAVFLQALSQLAPEVSGETCGVDGC